MVQPKLMLLPGSFSVALALTLLGMVCWGSWTNVYRLTRKWRLGHFHIDYSFGMLLIALLAALTAGMPGAFQNLRDAGPAALLYAAAGGVALNGGNLALMVGISRVGMAVAFPISVGFSLVVSTVLSYLVNPRGDAGLLAAGVALVFLAVLVNSAAYRARGAQKAGDSRGGIAFCHLAGVVFSVSGPLVAKAMASTPPLSPYGASVMFALGSLASSLPWVAALVREPAGGAPYRTGSFRNHFSGVLGGVIWGLGMVFTFLAAGLTGMALSGAIAQANPLIAALWGIFIWREFRGSPPRTRLLLALMFVFYLAGLVLLSLSFG